MKTRVRELIEAGDKLFSQRVRFMSLCQEVALHFYPERADFTNVLYDGDEFASHLMTGAPSLFRRELSNSLSAMLRPRDKPWFRARTRVDRINEDAGAKAFLDDLSDKMQRFMYAKRAQFVRSTKQGDNDFATFGQAVISVDTNTDNNGLLYRTKHIRDVAWCEDAELKIDTVHENWKLSARALEKLFKGNVHQRVKDACKQNEGHKEIKCRRIVMPADEYDYSDPSKKPRKAFPFISLHVDVENDFILEEKPAKRLGYVIPRWATISGSQYAHSPATVVALPDARLLQQITLTLLEAGQKAVDPPSVARGEAIQGPMQLFAGGTTWVDSEYDEQTGEALRYLPIDIRGLNFGMDREKTVMEMIRRALYLDQIDVPYPEGDMTATEYRGRVEQYIMRALPLFEPMEVEYNGGIVEESFDVLADDLKAFGAFDGMPEILRGQDIRWMFESPLQQATERSKSQAFLQTADLLKVAAQLDPTVVHDIDASKAFRDAVQGTGAPAIWIVPEDKAAQAKKQAAETEAAQSQMQQIGQGAAIAAQAGNAAQQISGGTQALQAAGIM